MKKIVKVFGLYHSGTNALNFLLKYNFNNHVCDEFLGWKHAYINDLGYINKISKCTNDEICTIFCVRNPYDWIYRFLQQSYEFIKKDIRSPIYSCTKHSQEIYENIPNYYNEKLKNYKDFIEKNNAIFICYEDLLNFQIETLEKIQKKFNLTQSYNQIVPFYKKINNCEHICSDFNRLEYKNYKINFSPEDIEFINNNLDINIVNYFGYPVSV